MALPALMLDYVLRAAEDLGGGRLCSAGYPDLLVHRPQLESLFGPERAGRIPIREDSAEILRWHGVASVFEGVFEARSAFGEAGLEMDVLDVVASRGGEIIVDLNHPLPPDFGRRYDIVLDTGTCEHCFNIGTAAMNLAGLVRAQGYLVQALPLNSFNHGFYNVNPTWFHDFYAGNGFRIELLVGVTNIVQDPQFFELPAHARFGAVPENSVAVMVARRVDERPLGIPVQHKYRFNPTLRNGDS